MKPADPIRKAYERAFTGSNRVSLSWAAYQAGWNAAKQSDQAVYDGIAQRYSRDVWEQRKAKAWAARDLKRCRCDHNEYCGKCWPVEFRKGGEFFEWTGEPSRSPVANHAETSSSPIATVHDPYDTPGIQWHCQHPPATGTKLYTRDDQ